MTITTTAPIAGIERTKINSIVFASCFGTIIEWYDFLIYATAATLVFNKAFFPTFDPLAGTLAALGSYAVGFLARPLGGALFGHFGDRLGRKSMLVLTLFIMGLSTFCIGLLPTYASIGVFAPILLILLRFDPGHRAWRRMGRRLADGAGARAGRQARLLHELRADRISDRAGAGDAGLRARHQIARGRFRELWLAHSVPRQHCAARRRHLRPIAGAGDPGVRRHEAARWPVEQSGRRSRRQEYQDRS